MVTGVPAAGSAVASLTLNRRAHDDAKKRKDETKERLRQHQQQITALRDIFGLIDEDDDGSIDRVDMQKSFEMMGLEVTQSEMSFMFANDELTLSSFVSMLQDHKPPPLRRLVAKARMYREMFALFDRDGSGEMTAEELGGTVTRLFGWRPTRYELEKMLACVDEDGDEFIQFPEFVAMLRMSRKDPALDRIKEGLYALNETFAIFEIDTVGIVPDFSISIVEFGKIMRSLGRSHSDKELKEMFAEIDVDGGGRMEFAEFAEFITGPETRVMLMVKERIGELRGLFNLFDEDSGGSVNLEELAQIMRKLGRRPSDQELQEAVSGMEVGTELESVELNFPAFVSLVVGTASRCQRCLQKQLSDFREAFDLFDEDGGGTVDLDEFVKMMEIFGHVSFDSMGLKDTVQQFDKDHDGELSFVDFVGMMVSEDPIVRRDIKSHLVGFREAFSLFDWEDCGVITTESFCRMWKEYGFQASEEQVIEMLQIADTDGSGELEFSEFVQMVAGAKSSLTDQIRIQLSELREIFSLFDPDGDGTITNDEIGDVLRNIVGMDISDEEVLTLTEDCDEDGNGEIDFSEFAGMMAKNFLPGSMWTGQNATQVRLGPVVSILKQTPDERGGEDIKKIRGCLDSLGVDFFDSKSISREVSNELCRQMNYKTLKPFQVFNKQNESASNYVFVMAGSLVAWRRKESTYNDEAPEGVEIDDPVLGRKQRAKKVSTRRGSIAGPSAAEAPHPTEVQYEASVWCIMERAIKDTKRRLQTASKEMPSSVDEGFAVKRLIQLTDLAQQQLNSWQNHGRDVVVSDVDDIRQHAVIMHDGVTCLETLHMLYMQADTVRREQLLTKFYLQLSTYASDRVPTMEAPFTEALANEYITLLEEENAAFIICTARPGYPIISCSEGFTELTGYSKEEVQGKNPRILQGHATNSSINDQIKRHLKYRMTDLTLMTSNYKKDGTCFVNKLYLAPVISESEEKVVRWVGVLFDATSVESFAKRKPVVQGIINVCKYLINNVRVTLETIGPPFGSPEWGNPENCTATLRQSCYDRGVLHPDDEFLGEVGVGISCGDAAFSNQTGCKAEVMLLAGKEGCRLGVITRQMWLQAHAVEPVRFLKSLPMFAQYETSKLQRVATMMNQYPVRYHQEIVSVGDPCTMIYLIKSGEVEIQVRVSADGSPIPLKQGDLKKRQRGVKSQAIALIGSGDAISDPEEVSPGVFVYGIDAIATTDDVVIYALPRVELNKLRGSKHAMVHSMALHRARAQHRNSHIKGMPRAQAQMRELMASPTNELDDDTGDEDLGWDSTCSRLPQISRTNSPAASASPAPSPELPQLRPRLKLKSHLAASYSKSGKGTHSHRNAALAKAVAVVDNMGHADQEQRELFEKRQPRRKQRSSSSTNSLLAKPDKAAFMPSDMLVAWNASDKTQIIRPKVQNRQRGFTKKEKAKYAAMQDADAGPVEAALRHCREGSLRVKEEKKPEPVLEAQDEAVGNQEALRRQKMREVADINMKKLQKLQKQVERLENKSSKTTISMHQMSI